MRRMLLKYSTLCFVFVRVYNIVFFNMLCFYYLNNTHRSAIQSLGTITNCEIEPSVRKNVLDETENIEGVEYACVPGAGGFDAICCVVKEEGEIGRVW